MSAAEVFAGARLKADLFARGNSRLIATFDFRTPGREGFRALSPSRQFEKNGFDQLVIRSAGNDWFINPETPALEAALTEAARGYGRVQALGYSMGGYGAFRFAQALGAASVVAVSPQATLDPGTAPWESRYRKEARGFDAAMGDLGPRAVPGLAGVIVADPFKRLDMAHAGLIRAIFPKVAIARLGFGGHPATKALRQAGKAWITQKTAMSEAPGPKDITRMHRRWRRKSPYYWTALAGRAGLRRAALAAKARDMAEKLAGAA